MDELASNILNKLNITSLEELSETLPTTLTTDAHILKAEKNYLQGKLWDTLHHLSLTHSTLMYHRLSHKQHRPQNSRRNSVSAPLNCKENDSEKNGISFLKEIPSSDSILRPSTVDETKRLFQLLPSDWTVVQITSENRQSGDERNWKKIEDPFHTPPLYVSRCRCGTTPSVIIKKIFPPNEENSVRSILQEIEMIKGENKVISKYYKNDQEKYLSKREEVNNRLRILVQSMENGWLRHFSCLLIGCLPPNKEVQVKKMMREAVRKSKVPIPEEQLALLTLLVSYPLFSCSSKGNGSFDFPLRAGIASLLQESVRSSNVRNLTSAVLEAQNKMKEIRSTTRSPVILILDKSVVSLPWEMIHALRNQSVTRMPSLQSLVHLYLHHVQKSDSLLTKGIDASKGFFILDPENNLPRSRDRLRETFNLTQWEGVQGQKPTQEQFKDALTNKDVFVYVGHGSGSQYMPAQLVETVDCKSLVLLYGCSSASLARRGAVPDPWGVILNYLISSCPCVVGMLWEVMDKDTDLLTREMVKALRGLKGFPGSPLEDPPTDLPLMVAKARPLCSWYLISAALVVYGLPLQVVPQMESNEDES